MHASGVRSPELIAADTAAATILAYVFRAAVLTGEIAALPGFEAVAEVAFPPLIGLVQVTDLHFVGAWVLRKQVAKG